jgi:hypothetical protein
MKYMHIVSFTYIILTLGIIIGFVGLLPSTHDLTGSFFSSSSYLSAFAQKPPINTGQEQHLSAFAQTPSSTNRVTAGQQQSTFGQHQGPTSSFLPFLPSSNQSTNAQTPSTTTAGDGSSSQNQSSSNTTTNNVPSNTNNTK